IRARYGPDRTARRRLPGTPSPAPRPRRRHRPAVPRTEPLQADPDRDGQNPRPPRAGHPGPPPRLGPWTAGHASYPPARPGDAPDPGRRQPDLHPRPARPRRRVHHRDLRPRRRGDQTQSDRKCLPDTHPRHPARLDLGHLPDRLARLAGPVTPTARIMRTKTLLAPPPPPKTRRQATYPRRPPNPANHENAGPAA